MKTLLMCTIAAMLSGCVSSDYEQRMGDCISHELSMGNHMFESMEALNQNNAIIKSHCIMVVNGLDPRVDKSL